MQVTSTIEILHEPTQPRQQIVPFLNRQRLKLSLLARRNVTQYRIFFSCFAPSSKPSDLHSKRPLIDPRKFFSGPATFQISTNGKLKSAFSFSVVGLHGDPQIYLHSGVRY